MANEVASVLAKLAKDGRTIVCTLHSPTALAFNLFQDLMLLREGRVMYGGPTDEVVPFLEPLLGCTFPIGHSLPEWLVDVTSGLASQISDAALVSADDLAVAYLGSNVCAKRQKERETLASSPDARQSKMDLAPTHSVGKLRALGTLLKYRLGAHYRSPEFLGPRIGDKVLMSVLILSLYWGIGDQADAKSIQSTASLLYFISALCGYGAAAFVPSLTLDRPLFYRELADGCYSPLVYYGFKFIEEAVLAVLTSTLFSCIVFFACALQGNFFIFAASYYLTTMTGIVLAYAVAAIVPTMDAANALLPTYVTMCMYFGGLFLLFDKIPVGWYWFSYTSFLRYSWGAQMNNQYRDSEVGKAGVYWDEDAGKAVTVLDFYGMEGSVMGSAGACIGLLAAITLSFAACGACALTHIRHERR